MEMMYRCMKCGTHVPPPPSGYPECNICKTETILVLVTESNKDKLPFPTDPVGRNEIDFNDPSKNCQCRAGTCPCGAFVAHKVTEPCNSHEYPQIEKAEQ